MNEIQTLCVLVGLLILGGYCAYRTLIERLDRLEDDGRTIMADIAKLDQIRGDANHHNLGALTRKVEHIMHDVADIRVQQENQ